MLEKSQSEQFVLYRKYRPQKWNEVVGQDHIVKVLEGSVKQGNIAHAYLFAGPRGTGKTSIARILARDIGCGDKDLYEIDAASNRGIDEIRQLREAVRSLPFGSPYKVYIVDEVHMLTKEAFNALLKTLEEPPAHVIFILATTEKDKLPETIISRCQTFAFRQPRVEELKKVVAQIAKKEGYSLDDDSLNLIALLGEGSFRDTLGRLQKIISYSKDKEITFAEVETITEAPNTKLIYDLVTAILDTDTDKALSLVNKAVAADKDMKVFLKMLLQEIRRLMLLVFAPDMEKEILAEVGDDEKEFLLTTKKHPGVKILPAVLKELLGAYQEMSYAYLPQLPLELALVKICSKSV